ncbi:hypothetical protein LshimejAT787_0104600 [Lyophyllum shimeji]|uniref:Uncharacterized protein n=1 Tax=Lyophyllum shimeji TaxID=47721 RepID=A0A9P3PCV5_LYOSH|nr:hypothetical protein LshimejAT787_0104600 [Lyophyllum shimeji]
MTLSPILQRCALQRGIIRRHVSTKTTKPKPKQKRTLPDEKLRALIALYHQADSFITPENLSQRIDEAFLSSTEPRPNTFQPTVKELQNALAVQRKAPKIAEWDQETLINRTPANGAADYRVYDKWSSVKTARELKVVEALYGVNAAKLGATHPGLEVLREAVTKKTVPEPLNPEDIKGFLEKEPMDVPKN